MTTPNDRYFGCIGCSYPIGWAHHILCHSLRHGPTVVREQCRPTAIEHLPDEVIALGTRQAEKLADLRRKAGLNDDA